MISRRTFVKEATGVGAAIFGGRPSAWAQAEGANGAVRLAVVGLGNKGGPQLRQLFGRKDSRIAAICDVDPRRLAKAVEEAKAHGLTPFATTEAREVFDRKDVDAVILVTPNHWHATQTVWACQAGKDVYVEKPVSHSVHEGRLMMAAAARHRRIVQVGMQYRSEGGLAEAMRFLHAGELGKILYVHCVCYGLRESIGLVDPWYPDWLDYDLYRGPAPVVPLRRKELHHAWRWMWDTGNGDLADNGVHILDVAMRVIGQTEPARRVVSFGGRLGYKDAGETPNAQLTVYDFAGMPVFYETRGLPAKPGVSYMDQLAGIRVGFVAYAEGGYVGGLTGATAYDQAGKLMKKFAGDGGGPKHLKNFLDAVHSRREQDLTAPIAIGHAAASLCHYGNISYRLGVAGGAGRAGRAIDGIPPATKAWRGLMAHLKTHGIDTGKDQLTIGPWLDVDPAADTITRVEFGGDATLGQALNLVRGAQRPPYVVPESV